MDIWIVSVILVVTVIFLVTEKMPVDLTAIGIMVVLVISGILTPEESVEGFANPAVITVGSMFLISRALIRTGVVGHFAQKVIDTSRGRAKVAVLFTMLTVAVASAFINNTPVVVLFIPIILSLSCEYAFSPSKFLIPISYASILTGTCTLIGTSTNIIVSDLTAGHGYAPVGMFELSPLGVPIALLGLVFIYFASPRLMPGHMAPTCEMADRKDRRYLAEFIVPEDSKLAGKKPDDYFAERYTSFEVFEIIRQSHVFYPDESQVSIKPGDFLLLKGSAVDIVNLLNDGCVQLPPVHGKPPSRVFEKESLFVELMVPPQSSLVGQQLIDSTIMEDPQIQVIAIKRRRLHYAEQKVKNLTLRIGDIILIRCDHEKLSKIRRESDLIIIEDIHHAMVIRKKAPLGILIFAGVVLAATLGLANIMVCALTGVFLIILTGCLQIRDAYRALRPDVLILIAGTIALGTAMEKTGASGLYAEVFLSFFKDAGPRVVLAAFVVMTSIGTQILSNNATAVLLLPIAISTAVTLGVDPRPFVIGICFGASACFASPIGYQTNLMVYGPGGYRFSDYLKLGIPLNILVVVCASLGIPLFWEF